MAQDWIQDRIRWGMNVAARAAGASTDAYRPSSSSEPLRPENRYLRLPALFTGLQGRFTHPNPYGSALVQGLFDAAYTRAGDYLVQPAAIWFIASQEPLLPVLCVRTNRTVSFLRPAAPAEIGAGTYGGLARATATSLLDTWPASVLGVSASGEPRAGLPGDAGIGAWTVLLPTIPDTLLRPADLMTDDLGRNAVVIAAELSELGWRLTVKQATT